MKSRYIKLLTMIALVLIIPFVFSNAEKKLTTITDEEIQNSIQKIEHTLKANDGILLGTKNGLYKIANGQPEKIWSEGEVHKIHKVGDEWFIHTSAGLFASSDLVNFESRNTGLPFYTLKKIVNGQKEFVNQQAALKDFAYLIEDPSIVVTLTKDEVFLSRDSGKTWKSLGFSARTNGAKAIAVANMPAGNGTNVLTVFMVHSLYGISYIQPDLPKASWVDLVKGFETVKNVTSGPDEISDIITVRRPQEDGTFATELYISQTYRPCLYRLNWEDKKGELIGKDFEILDTIDSLYCAGNKLIYVKPRDIGVFDLTENQFEQNVEFIEQWKKAISLVEDAESIFVPEECSVFGQSVSLSELWLLQPDKIYSDYVDKIENKKALYMPAGKATPGKQLQSYIDIMKANGLDTAVIDMKDDYGLLRYISNDDFVNEKATSSMYALDIDAYVKQCKENDIYLVARIVAFKDRNIWRFANGKYAVKDSSGKSWQGIKSVTKITDADGNVTGTETEYYDEHWVDPYCEDVWAYNVAIAKELISRGFDEIQFDYIRFPTDGTNLTSARYTWCEHGMEKEGALMSFLAYARENIDAPIGIDIYGANGWNRSGARTGQDVEMLADYVDVICPMFYPSHFEQNFLDYAPAKERPYRIYFYGSYRNAVIARNKALIRPWLQAFYLAVSYDKKYYDEDYVIRQVYGTRDSINKGYMYWNNSGRYDDISPDPGDGEYPWTSTESSKDYRKPAL